MIYFDNAATTPMASEVIEEMVSCMEKNFGNPSSVYQLGRSSKALLESSRKKLGGYLGCLSNELFFMSSATEAHNHILKQLSSIGIEVVITSKLEHAAVLGPLKNNKSVKVLYLDNNSNGELDYGQLKSLLHENNNVLVSLMHVNNELGNVNDIAIISELCKQNGALFHCDAVQSVGHGMLDLSKVEVDFLVGSAHKFHGPKGVGFLYVRKGIYLPSYISGGKQEQEFRAGTENVAGIIGLSTAVDLIEKSQIDYENRIKGLKSYFLERVSSELPMIHINGSTNTVGHIVNLGIKTPKLNKMFLFALDLKGFAVSGGSACSSGAVKSHVAQALGIPDSEGYVRVSFSRYNTIEEIDKFILCLKEML